MNEFVYRKCYVNSFQVKLVSAQNYFIQIIQLISTKTVIFYSKAVH